VFLIDCFAVGAYELVGFFVEAAGIRSVFQPQRVVHVRAGTVRDKSVP